MIVNEPPSHGKKYPAVLEKNHRLNLLPPFFIQLRLRSVLRAIAIEVDDHLILGLPEIRGGDLEEVYLKIIVNFHPAETLGLHVPQFPHVCDEGLHFRKPENNCFLI